MPPRKFEGAPMVLAFVLGPMFETSLRQSLLLSDGSFLTFFNRPIAAGAMVVTLLMLISSIFPTLRRKREAIPIQEIK